LISKLRRRRESFGWWSNIDLHWSMRPLNSVLIFPQPPELFECTTDGRTAKEPCRNQKAENRKMFVSVPNPTLKIPRACCVLALRLIHLHFTTLNANLVGSRQYARYMEKVTTPAIAPRMNKFSNG
jgi:hypothetical protein